MNKSKFLKKSLAALLAVMLVVAMIPLSAAAAPADVLPALTRIYVDGKEITANGTAFSANFAEDQAEGTITVSATLPAGTKLEAFTSENSLTPKDEITASETDNLTVKDFTGGATEGTVYLKLSPSASDDGRAPVWYTLNLKQVTLDDKSGVKGVSVADAGKNNGLLNATVDQDNLIINVEAAYGYTSSIAAGITIEPTDGATVSGGNNVTVTNNGQFTVTAGGINTVWTIKVTEVEALLDFSVAGKQGTIDHEKKTIKVDLTLDDIKDKYDDVETSPNRAIEFSTITNTQIGWESTSATGLTTEISSGAEKPLTNIKTTMKYEGIIWVKNGSASTGVGYALTVQVPKNTDTAISYAAIGGVEATIDGTNITTVLNKGTTGMQGLRLHVPKGAKVTPGVTTSTANWDVDEDESSEYDVWTTASTDGSGTPANAAKTAATPGTKKTFVVTAADNTYSTQYSIWYTVAEGQTEAALKSLNLKNGDDVYTGTVDESAKSVTVEVPYMTTDMAGWKIFATYSEGAIGTYNGDPIMSGITAIDSAQDGNVNLQSGITDDEPQTLKDFITVNSQGTTAVETKYNLVVKFKAANNNKLLTGLKVTVQDNNPALSEQKLVRGMTDKNTYSATITDPTFDADLKTTKMGKIEIETAHSLRKDASADLVMAISEITTNGGVAYAGFTSSGHTLQIGRLDVLDGKKTTGTFGSSVSPQFNNFYGPSDGQWATVLNDTTTGGSVKFYVVVLPEEVAKRYNAKVLTKGNANLDASDYDYRAIYEVSLKYKAPNAQGKLESLTIAGQTMRVTTGSDGKGTIIGTIPYSATVANVPSAGDNATNSQFLEFKVSDYAALGKTGSAKPTNELFVNAGDKNGDGEADTLQTGNAKLFFKRGADHKVEVYSVYDTTATAARLQASASDPDTISVYSEAYASGTPTNTYKFDLKYADACKEADITSFDLSGNKGSISGKTINVSVPKGTNMKALRATFETSIGAKVYLDKPTDPNPTEVKSGKTVLNCSSDVKIYVRSEDGSKTEVYTVKVTEGEMFLDVNKSDWFYEEVNTAALNGWINGTGDGYFTPYGNMSRGQFALIIARMDESFDEEADVDCPFPDVNSTAYKAAAKYVFDKGWMQGDGNNFFNADDNITRAQAAIVLCKMNSIEPISGNTTYADDASIADWAKGYVKAATAANIFKGEGDDFNPQRALRRCEGAAILVRSASK